MRRAALGLPPWAALAGGVVLLAVVVQTFGTAVPERAAANGAPTA